MRFLLIPLVGLACVSVSCGDGVKPKTARSEIRSTVSLVTKEKILTYFEPSEQESVFLLPVADESNSVGVLFRTNQALYSPRDLSYPVGATSVKVCADKPILSVGVLTCCNNPIGQVVKVTSASEHCKEVSPIEFKNPRFTLDVRLEGGDRVAYKPAEVGH